MGDARGPRGVLDRHPHPDVPRPRARPVAALQVAPHARRALGEYLEDVAIRPLHGVEHPVHEGPWDLLVEEVAHGVHEHRARAAPGEGLLEPLGALHKVEAALEGVTRRAAEALGQAFGVAVVAAAGDLGAARHRVPVVSVHSIALRCAMGVSPACGVARSRAGTKPQPSDPEPRSSPPRVLLRPARTAGGAADPEVLLGIPGGVRPPSPVGVAVDAVQGSGGPRSLEHAACSRRFPGRG